MFPRFFVDITLAGHDPELSLPPGAARHVQVLRLQPGAALTLFDGTGFDWPAQVLRIGRSEVVVQLGAGQAVQRELAQAVTLALVMPANDRMDFVLEKATELGAAAVQPLMSERSVLRLNTERWYRFADISSVEGFLDELLERSPEKGGALVVKLPRLSGTREQRWAHLLCGPVDVNELESVRALHTPGGLAERVERLEQELAQLRQTVQKLCAELGVAPDAPDA